MRINVAIAVACLSVATAAVGANAEAAIRRPMNIPEQPLDAALQLLAKQRDLQMIYPYEVVGTLRTRGVTGEMTFEEALSALLSGTGLDYKYLDEKTVTIVPSGSNKDGQRVAPVSSMNHQDDATLDAGGDSTATTRLVWKQLTLAQTSATSAAQDVEDSNTTERLEEVIVTAQKREERLQDVPISISVLSGDMLDRSSTTSVQDALNRTPGVAINSGSNSGLAAVNMRGVTSPELFIGSSVVGYYVDGVPFGFVKSGLVPDAGVYDLDRIEVLRGPQGTLYGANALNGVIRILTEDPDLRDFDVKARASVASTEDGSESHRGDFAVNLPMVTDRLGARVVVGQQALGGWIDTPLGDDVNDTDLLNVRAKLRAAPTDQLTIDLSAWASRSDSGGLAASAPDRTRSATAAEPISTDFDAYGAELGYDFGGVQLTSTTSYIDFQSHSVLDFGPYYVSLGFGSLVPPEGLPFQNVLDANVFAQELVLNSTGDGAWRWTIGAFYRDAEDRVAQGFVDAPYDTDYINGSESIAAFGELTRTFMDGQLELTGGLRYFRDEVTVQEVRTPSSPPALINTQRDFAKVTPRVVVSWHPTDNATVYGSYAQGFRSGLEQDPVVLRGSNFGLPSTEPDTLHNYEVGLKTSLLDGLIDIEAAAFYIDWRDVQQSITVNVMLNGTPTPYAGVLNGGDLSGPGIEGAITLRPTEGLSISANFSWNDLTFGPPPPGTSNGAREGERLSGSPEFLAGGSVNYRGALGSSGAMGRFSLLGTYQGESFLRTSSGTLVRGDDLFLVRVEAGIEPSPNWSLNLFVDNLANDYSGGANVWAPLEDWVTRHRPRTIGLQIEYQM